MAKSQLEPDYSFERDGVPLRQWLWQLLDEDSATRRRAGEALNAIAWGVPSVHTDFEDLAVLPDFEAQQARFDDEVRRLVRIPDFDQREFVSRLSTFLLVTHEEMKAAFAVDHQRDEERGERFERLFQRLVDQSEGGVDALDSESKKRAARLMRAYVCGGCDEPRAVSEAEGLSESGTAAQRIFQLLDVELLSAPHALHQLWSADLRSWVLPALIRIGPPAVGFADRLLQELDDANSPWFDGAEALGTIGRGDSSVVQSLISRLRSTRPDAQANAAAALRHMGPEVDGREREICELLESMLVRPEENLHAIYAFASVGRHLANVRQRVLELAQPHEPLAPSPSREEYYSAEMAERGAALSSLCYFKDYADECLPTLIEALETFQEFDPDQGYYGPASRIASVLESYGTAAGPAVIPLARHLEDDLEMEPSAIVEALVAIGPAAQPVLPQLHILRERFAEGEELADLAAGPVNRDDDSIGWAIQQISGE